MNVLLIPMAVLTFAPTQMDLMPVVVELGTGWLLINVPVKVYLTYTILLVIIIIESVDSIIK